MRVEALRMVPLRSAGRASVIFFGSLIGCVIAQLITPGDPHRLTIWPAGGIALACAMHFGRAWMVPAVAGVVVWSLLRLQTPAMVLAIALATSAGPSVVATGMKNLEAWKPADHGLEVVLRFMLLVALVGAPLDAILSTVIFSQTAEMGEIHPMHLFVGWWLIDTLGMMLIAPALLAFVNGGLTSRQEPGAGALSVDGPSVAATVTMLVASMLLVSFDQRDYGYALVYCIFPIVTWMAIRTSEAVTALSLIVTAPMLLAARGYQVWLAGDDLFRALEASLILLCAVIIALILQAVAADRRLALVRIGRQARQDMSTGLLNDRGLLAELGDRLADQRRPNFGLIGVHITNFDAVNDLCGSLAGLQLEQSAADMLVRQRSSRLASRMSAGRYAVLVDADALAQVRVVSREIYAQLNGQPFHTDNGSLRLQVSVGGLLIDRSADIHSEDALSALSDAMAIASSVRDPQLFVEPMSQTMLETRRAHHGKIEEIREAIREHRFDVHAQLIFDPRAPRGMLSYEVLTRLRDRAGNLIRPPEFLPLAVQARMTVLLDRGVIQRVFTWLADNPVALGQTHKCSINLSGMTMSDGTIAGFIREQRAIHDLPADRIVFEITEGEAIRNPAAASRLVDDLKAEGFGIALDDFGTGLATFEYLKRFPIDYLKIDGSFIRNVISNPIDEEIVLSTIRVARRLNVKTVAEHVHSREIYDRLVLLGVDHLQGEAIGAARPIDTLFHADAAFHG